MHFRTLARLSSALIVAVAATAGAQVQNGSFEAPLTTSYSYLTGTMNSWTYTGGAGVINTQFGPTAFNSQPATSGNQVAFVQSNGSSISQTLSGLTVGSYSLSFNVAGRNCNCGFDGNTAYGVYFGGNLIGSGTTASGSSFATQTYTFATTSTSGALSIVNQSDAGDHTFMVDDVAVSLQSTTTPEPATFTLLGGGLLALVAAARRRRQA
jgi:hypothetical protein